MLTPNSKWRVLMREMGTQQTKHSVKYALHLRWPLRGHPGSPRDPPWLLQVLFSTLSAAPYWALLSSSPPTHSGPPAPICHLPAPPSAQCSLLWLKIMPSTLLITADRLIHTVSSKLHTGILPLYSTPAFFPWLPYAGLPHGRRPLEHSSTPPRLLTASATVLDTQ